MQFTLKRLLVVVAVAALLLALYVGAAGIFANKLTITNASSRTVSTIDVTVWQQTVSAYDLPPGDSTVLRFRSHNSDSGFLVHVTFDDGSAMDHTDGYVTGGSITGERCTITITDDEIDIDQRIGL